MASRKRVPKPAALKQAPKAPSTDPLEYEPTILSLSRARAAWFLLSELREGFFSHTYEINATPEEAESACGWLEHLARRELKEALDEAEAAYRKSRNTKAEAAA